MKKGKKHIDDLFREKLGDYSEAPPSDAWSDLDKKLDTLVPVPGTPPGRFRWVGHVGMISLITVMSVSLIHKYVAKKAEDAKVAVVQSDKLDAVPGNVNAVPTAYEPTETAVASDQLSRDATVVSEAQSTDESSSGSSGTVSTPMIATDRGLHSRANSRGNHNRVMAAKGRSHAKTQAMDPFYQASSGENEYAAKILEATEQVKPLLAADGVDETIKAANKAAAERPMAKPVSPSVVAKAGNTTGKHVDFNRWVIGVKAGFEQGFTNNAASKMVIAPYVQYKLSPRVALMTQPAMKYAMTRDVSLGAPQSYYKVNGDGKAADNGSFLSTKVEGGSVTVYYNSVYRYSQTHDSIVKTNTTGGAYFEADLPILLSYAVTNRLSVYGGPNVAISRTTGIKEHTYTATGITRIADTTISSKEGYTSAPPVEDIIQYQGTPISSYGGPFYPSRTTINVRLGAMAGISYQCSDRVLVDALVQKSPARRDIKGGYDVNTPLSATYFRLSVGYKLTK